MCHISLCMCIHVFCYKFLKILFNYMIDTLCILPLKVVTFTVLYRIKIRGYKNQVYTDHWSYQHCEVLCGNFIHYCWKMNLIAALQARFCCRR
jgi:hypothetical protein